MKVVILAALLVAAVSGHTLLPREPKWEPEVAITFYSYTRQNPNLNVPIQIFVGNLNGSLIVPSKDTKIIVHGFTDSAFSGWMEAAKDAYLRVSDVNVILVNWENIANVLNVRETGTYIGQLYDFLASLDFLTKDFHCSGHSLGGHVCGFSGKTVTAGTVGRITGLDPSESTFEVENPAGRLADTDADYVDVIHTSGGNTGYLDPIGQSDYFPNGGVSGQPGCGIEIAGICSHTRVRDLFIESIESEGFVSVQCDSQAEFEAGSCDTNPSSYMGEPSEATSRGKYYLATRGRQPYALG